MKNLTAVVLVLIILSACNQSKKKYLSSDVLEKQFFNIDPLHDTTLVTKNGIVIEIPANSISVQGNVSVQLEVKEALRLNEILSAGLTTNSGEQTLSSQGMFFISSTTKDAVIKKQISAKVPIDKMTEGMDIFKGKMNNDSTIAWNRKEKTTSTGEEKIAAGKSLFMSNCKACHEIDKDATGPILAGLTSKRSMDWLIKFTRNFNDLLAECNCEAVSVANSRPSAMNLFPNLTDKEVKNIFLYVDNEAGGFSPSNPLPAFCYDECNTYVAKLSALKQKAEIIRYAADTTPAVIVNYLSNLALPPPTRFTPIANTNNLVGANVNYSYYYQVEVDAWGWYNIDILMKDLPQLSPSSLIVNVEGASSRDITVSLVVPYVKCFTHGGLINNSNNQYAFMYKDGKINLPIGAEGYVLAYGDVDGKFIFAAEEFTIAASQQFTLTPLAAEPKVLQEYLATISSNELKTKIKELEAGKQLDGVKAEMAKLEKEKPDCDCFCYYADSTRLDSHGYHPCSDATRLFKTELESRSKTL